MNGPLTRRKKYLRGSPFRQGNKLSHSPAVPPAVNPAIGRDIYLSH